ncbi:hypothetical protein IKA15_05545 [bacterium]|nr:hypothetical protein [bacterium]
MSENYKRWYDYDPTLLKIINLLRDYQSELRSQAEVFLEKVEEQVSKEAIDRFYDMVKPINGKRWYDKDPVISKTVELLRVVPAQVQHMAAENFIKALQENGIIVEDKTEETNKNV